MLISKFELHPHHLGDALCVTIHTGVFAHDVADGFYGGGYVAHLGSFKTFRYQTDQLGCSLRFRYPFLTTV